MTDQTTSTIVSSQALPSPQPLIPNLPDDISLHILAKIPCSDHPYLSLVSKSWHSTITSPALFNTRSALGTIQTSLYLNLRINSSFHWYSLKPKNKNLILLPSIPTDLGCQPIGSSFCVLGPKIYIIGGSIHDIPSNNVWVYDCRFNKWAVGPKMRVAREFAAAGTWNGKTYVMGGCVVDNWARSMNWAEVFDPKIESWDRVPSPIEVRDKWMHASAVIGSRIYAMADRGGVVYNAESGQWGNVSKRLDLGWRGRATVVGNVLYCYDYLGKIRGYDVEKDVWKELKGVEKELPKFLCGATMVNLDEKLCVVWEGKGSGKEVEIMCAEIEVKKDADGGLRGTILCDCIFEYQTVCRTYRCGTMMLDFCWWWWC
ncbi:unnamed protein product [Fraxinus pennsylvanica]|uniref:F-box domain-containing protein n=1 Tax=Fraxinus pennsylvanica TaxID=56036 RepID=A0AAD2A287_9LAMI|nr:unnamed protein product [Fraxinus pennsylvanica]